MIRVLLVDAGGVLFNNVTENTAFLPEMAARYGADPDLVRRHLRDHDAEYETGYRDVHDVLTEALAAGGGSPLRKTWIDELYLRCVHHYPHAFDTLRWLRRSAPGLALGLANNEAAHWDHLKNRRYGHLSLFTAIYSSWLLGAVKPTAEYFSAVREESQCEADEMLLIDDNPEVIAAAREQQISTLHVTEPDVIRSRLSSTLCDLGVA